MPLTARQQTRLLQRAADRLPRDVLGHVLSFVPTKARSALKTGLAVLRESFSDLRFRVGDKLTFIPERVAKEHWRKRDRGYETFKSRVLYRYKDFWYDRPCVAYSGTGFSVYHRRDEKPWVKFFLSCDCYRSDYDHELPATHAWVRIDGLRSSLDVKVPLPPGVSVEQVRNRILVGVMNGSAEYKDLGA